MSTMGFLDLRQTRAKHENTDEKMRQTGAKHENTDEKMGDVDLGTIARRYQIPVQVQ